MNDLFEPEYFETVSQPGNQEEIFGLLDELQFQLTRIADATQFMETKVEFLTRCVTISTKRKVRCKYNPYTVFRPFFLLFTHVLVDLNACSRTRPNPIHSKKEFSSKELTIFSTNSEDLGVL